MITLSIQLNSQDKKIIYKFTELTREKQIPLYTLLSLLAANKNFIFIFEPPQNVC